MFDLVYSTAIWAHLNDEEVCVLYKNAYQHIKHGGGVIICEQTAPYCYAGKNYLRRTTEQYVDLLKSTGFEVKEVTVIDFWLHRILMERHLVKWICARKMYVNIEPDEIKVALNRNI